MWQALLRKLCSWPETSNGQMPTYFGPCFPRICTILLDQRYCSSFLCKHLCPTKQGWCWYPMHPKFSNALNTFCQSHNWQEPPLLARDAWGIYIASKPVYSQGLYCRTTWAQSSYKKHNYSQVCKALQRFLHQRLLTRNEESRALLAGVLVNKRISNLWLDSDKSSTKRCKRLSSINNSSDMQHSTDASSWKKTPRLASWRTWNSDWESKGHCGTTHRVNSLSLSMARESVEGRSCMQS